MTKITDQLFAQLRYQIFNYAYSITSNTDDAEDIVQNAFYKFYIQEQEIKHPKSWLYKVAYNMSLNVLKKRERVRSLEALKEQVNYEIPSYDEEIEKHKDDIPFEVLRQHLSKLDLKIYKYYFVKQLSSAEIAKKNDIKLKTAQKYVQRMRRNLKAAILKEQGLTWTKNILTYQQYENVGNFIKLLIKKTGENNLISLKSYFQDFKLENMPEFSIHSIRDWGIRINESGYLMTLFCVDENKDVFFLCIGFKINKLNRLKIFNIRKPNFFKSKNKSLIRTIRNAPKGSFSYKEIKEIEEKKRLQ